MSQRNFILKPQSTHHIACIAAGSFVERMKFHSMLIFFVFLNFLVYCIVTHWFWGGGFLGKWGVIDFAGGFVVHIVTGLFFCT